MPIKLIREDITRMSVDAIVNPSNEILIPGGGVDLAIHRAAGSRLAEACARLGGCLPGQARLTPGYGLPCRFVIHTVGPVWQGGDNGEEQTLRACYTEALSLAKKRHCRSIAFPLIASGANGCPKERVLRIAMEAIGAFLQNADMTVYVVVYDKTAYRISETLYDGVAAYIDDRYVEALTPPTVPRVPENRRAARIADARPKFYSSRPSRTGDDASADSAPGDSAYIDSAPAMPAAQPCAAQTCAAPTSSPGDDRSLEEILRSMDKGFSETLFDYIDAKGMTDVECYKRANIDRKTFSKIKCAKNYRPSKQTVLSFAIALRLTPAETDHLLNTVGMSLSHSSKFDLIVEYFIKNGNYDIFEINETLFQFDQMLLGV